MSKHIETRKVGSANLDYNKKLGGPVFIDAGDLDKQRKAARAAKTATKTETKTEAKPDSK